MIILDAVVTGICVMVLLASLTVVILLLVATWTGWNR